MNYKSTSKIRTIISHEYLTKVKSKGFIIGTLLAPLGIILIYGIMIIVSITSMDKTAMKIAILDFSGGIGNQLVETDTSKFYLTQKSEAELKDDLLKEQIDSYLILPADFMTKAEATVYTRGGGGLGFTNLIEKNTKDIVMNKKLKEINADSSVINLVEKGVIINTKKVTVEGTKQDYSQILAFLGYFLGFVIYGLMFTYGAFVMRGVIEEKTNRIVEVLASSAKPFEIMFGKVVGIGAVGLTQVLFWLILSSILMAIGGGVASHYLQPQDMAQMASQPGAPNQNEMLLMLQNFHISPWIIIAFLYYFIAGYFIYSTLFAAVGSAVDQEQDAAQLQIPIMIPIIIPILFISNVMANPNGTLSTVLSLIPFFTPILMIARIAAGEVPIWQIALSIILTIGTFLGALWVAAKIYRVGILMYGKKPTFKDIIKWFSLAK
jgi:ABC-2 type transport system permease protein